MLFAFTRLKVALDLPDNKPLMYIVGDAVGELEGLAVFAGTGSPTEGRPDRDCYVDGLAQFDPVHGGLDPDKTQNLCSSKGSVSRRALSKVFVERTHVKSGQFQRDLKRVPSVVGIRHLRMDDL